MRQRAECQQLVYLSEFETLSNQEGEASWQKQRISNNFTSQVSAIYVKCIFRTNKISPLYQVLVVSYQAKWQVGWVSASARNLFP